MPTDLNPLNPKHVLDTSLIFFRLCVTPLGRKLSVQLNCTLRLGECRHHYYRPQNCLGNRSKQRMGTADAPRPPTRVARHHCHHFVAPPRRRRRPHLNAAIALFHLENGLPPSSQIISPVPYSEARLIFGPFCKTKFY